MSRRGGIAWPGLLVLLMAALVQGGQLPPAPEGHVLDEAGLFDRAPERLEAVSRQLGGVSARHGVPVHLVLYGGLLDDRIESRARQLHGAWIGPDRDGMVAVWDVDTGDLAFGLPRATFLDGGLEAAGATRLPDQRLRPVLEGVRADVKGTGDKKERVERLVGSLARRLDGLFGEKAEPPRGGAWSVALATVVLGGVLAGLGAWAGRFIRRAEEAPQRRCYFPDVLVGARLGAPCGGGRVAVVHYDREEPEEVE